MDITQIKETSLYVQDLERTENFYREKLNFEVIAREEERHVFFRAGTSVLLCFLSGATKNDDKLPPHYAEGNIHIAFEVPKAYYKALKKQLELQDITIEHEEHWFDDYYSFYFRDPDDHLLEIVPKGMWD